MEPPGPTITDQATVSDEASVLSEYCMDGEARSPHRNLPYPDDDDESSVRSFYYPTGETETDEMSLIDYSDSSLGTDPWIDVRTTISSDSSAHSIPPDDYIDRYRAMFRSHDDTSSTSSSSDSLATAWDVFTARSASSDYEPVLRTARYQPRWSEYDDESTSSWTDDGSLLEAQPPNEEMLRDVIPSPYRYLVLLSLFDVHHSPVELYEALGIAIQEVHVVQEKWKVAEAEDPLERARRIRKLRAVDEIRAVSTAAASPEEAYSRACGVCYADAPRERAVLTACGHIVCAPCADTMTRGGGRLVCPYCRVPTGYVVLVEEGTDDGLSDAETNVPIDGGIKYSPVSCHLPLNY